MANYQLGPVIGKIGGAGVQKIALDITADGDAGSVVGETINVPDGEKWLIVLQGDINASSTRESNAPQMVIGERASPPLTFNAYTAFSTEVIGPANVLVGLRRNTSSNSDSFAGHVYTTPLP